MEKKKIDPKLVSEEVGKAAGFLNSAKKALAKAVDRDGDGRPTFDDITVVTDTVKDAVKDGTSKWTAKQEQRRQEKEFEELRPVFSDDLESADFSLSKLIRITGRDKKHEESELCRGSIGFYSDTKELRFLNIYRDKTNLLGVSFYPNLDSEVYYVDPTDRNHYIALDSYFTYLKMARSNELQQIAQKLGAKHFRVTLMEEQTESAARTFHVKAGAKATARQGGALDASHEASTSAYRKIGISAEMDCPGHDPERPKLVYLQKDLNVQNLIELRMAKNPLTHQKVTVSFSQSSGIKVKDAMKIDSALNAMKITVNSNVTSEAEKETHRVFEYEIDF